MIIINDEYILMHLCIPIIMIFLLIVIIYFHRHHVLRYLYFINILLYLAAIICYFILIKHASEKGLPVQCMSDLPLVWLIGIFGGYFLSFLSISCFVIENARKHTWAKTVLGIARVLFILLCIFGVYFLIEGILSLKSG